MGKEKLELMEPTQALESEYLALLDEFRAIGEPFHQDDDAPARSDFGAFVKRLKRRARGLELRDGEAPEHTFWLVRGGRLVGTSRLREYLRREVGMQKGHIGYYIRPSERGKGYATRLLSATLEKAREAGLPQVLLMCAASNPASAKVIEKNGGVLEGGIPKADREILRYWIDLSPARRQAG